MQSTLDLLTKGLSTAPSEAALSRELGLSRATLNIAKHRGRLSPIVAGKLAERLGLPVLEWMAKAAAEQEPDIAPPGALRKALANLRI